MTKEFLLNRPKERRNSTSKTLQYRKPTEEGQPTQADTDRSSELRVPPSSEFTEPPSEFFDAPKMGEPSEAAGRAATAASGAGDNRIELGTRNTDSKPGKLASFEIEKLNETNVKNWIYPMENFLEFRECLEVLRKQEIKAPQTSLKSVKQS